MMLSRGHDARDDYDEDVERQLPWDPFWEFFLGDDTDDDDEPTWRRKPFAAWRRNNGTLDDHDDESTACEEETSYTFGSSMFGGTRESEEPTGGRRLGFVGPITKAFSGGSVSKEQRQQDPMETSSRSTRQPSTNTASKESIDVWELDLPPFLGGSKEELEDDVAQNNNNKKKGRMFRSRRETTSRVPVERTSNQGEKRRFFSFGKQRRNGQASVPAITQAKGRRRSLFSRSKSTTSTVATDRVTKETKLKTKTSTRQQRQRKSEPSVSTTSAAELTSVVGLTKGLESLSNSGSKVLDWMGEESSEESATAALRTSRVDSNTKDTKRHRMERDTTTLEDSADPSALSDSFNAILNWMEGSETENSSVGTSTLDDSRGTHSTDVPTSSQDGTIEHQKETAIDENHSIQLSSQIFDDSASDSITNDQEQSLEDGTLGTDENTYEESLEEIMGSDFDHVHIFGDEESSAVIESTGNVGNHHVSAFSPTASTNRVSAQAPRTEDKGTRAVQSVGARQDVIKPKPVRVEPIKSFGSEQNSIIEEIEDGDAPQLQPQSRSRQRGSLSRIRGYLPARTLTPQQKYLSTNKGVSYHELSTQELAELFPKVRSIGDEDSSVASSFFADQAEFDQSKPAHLQASIPKKGPQSLYEYEYETGVHMYATYSELGSEQTCPMTVDNARVPVPVPIGRNSKEKYVIIQVEASTVSQTDCIIRNGDWWGTDAFSLPNSPGVDVVGRIYSLDPETKRKTGFMKGERVMSLVQWGGNSRYIPLEASKLVKVPEYVDPAMTVCLAETYLTAFQVLHIDKARDERYENLSLRNIHVLIIGKAITNLGRAISELGKIAGAKVFALAKERHFEKVSSIGIRPRDVDSLDWWNELCGKIDTIVCIEEDVPTIYYKLLKDSGRVVMIRNPANANIRIGPSKSSSTKSRRKSKRQNTAEQPDATKLYDVYSEWKTNLDLCKADLNHLIDKLVEKDLQPQVLDRIPLTKVGQAQHLIKGRSIKGYIICEPWLVAKSRAIVL